MPVESEIERGARMKSVGILATSYTLLYRHLQFLETQVRLVHETVCLDVILSSRYRNTFIYHRKLTQVTLHGQGMFI